MTDNIIASQAVPTKEMRFVSSCIEAYKMRNGKDDEAIWNAFSDAGVIDFLCKHFEVEHALDMPQILDDIETIINRQKKIAHTIALCWKHGGNMQGVVTQENLHLFISGKIAGVAAIMAETLGISQLEALGRFYKTKVCKLLEREETKFWHYSPAQLYQLEEDLNNIKSGK